MEQSRKSCSALSSPWCSIYRKGALRGASTMVGQPTYIYFFFHHTTCESTCDTLASSAANQGDNTVSVAQGGTATPGATEQLLPPDRVFKRNIYLCIHKIN